jgi:signal transduction histidine kinase
MKPVRSQSAAGADAQHSYAVLVHGLDRSLQAARGSLELLERESPGLSAQQLRLLTNARMWIENAAMDVLSGTYRAFGVRVRPWMVSEALTGLRLFTQQMAARHSQVKGNNLVVRWRQHEDEMKQREGVLDFNALRLIVSELLDNAVKYATVDGAAHVTVDVSLTPRALELRFVDHGPGIPSHQADLVFEDGFRGELERDLQPQGVGRGLFDCDRLMKQMGGTISLASTPTGVTVLIVLPLQEPEARS